MFALTGTPLLVLTVVLAVLAVLAVPLLVWAASRIGPAARRQRLVLVAAVTGVVLLSQALAVSAVALKINDDYGFYANWADLTGSGPGQAPISTVGLLGPGQGALNLERVSAHDGGYDNTVMVWTPPGYDPHAPQPYPVVMFVPGQPASPQITFDKFKFAQTASQLIIQGRLQPFVAVFPTLMIDPPRDTECTNVQGGPQAETWLASDVPHYVIEHYRVGSLGRSWSLMGWSTGAFCAAKVLLRHTADFGSAAAFGGYYAPIQDYTTGSLFNNTALRQEENSPIWLYQHNGGLHGTRLLLIAGKHDVETWPETKSMLFASAGDPAVNSILFPRGGHNYTNYQAFLGPALIWSAASWPRPRP